MDTFLIVIVVAFALMWLLLIRPQRRRSNEQLEMQDQLRVGDRIITAGGLHATVQSIEDDVLEIEIAPGMLVRLDRRAVAALESREEPEEEEDAEPENENPPVSKAASEDEDSAAV